MRVRTQKKVDYPVCRTMTPHSTWFLDPLRTSESETPRSLYVVPWDQQLQIIPELQEAGRFRSSVHCRPASLLDSTHTVDIKDISIQSRSKGDLHLSLRSSYFSHEGHNRTQLLQHPGEQRRKRSPCVKASVPSCGGIVSFVFF